MLRHLVVLISICIACRSYAQYSVYMFGFGYGKVHYSQQSYLSTINSDNVSFTQLNELNASSSVEKFGFGIQYFLSATEEWSYGAELKWDWINKISTGVRASNVPLIDDKRGYFDGETTSEIQALAMHLKLRRKLGIQLNAFYVDLGLRSEVVFQYQDRFKQTDGRYYNIDFIYYNYLNYSGLGGEEAYFEDWYKQTFQINPNIGLSYRYRDIYLTANYEPNLAFNEANFGSYISFSLYAFLETTTNARSKVYYEF